MRVVLLITNAILALVGLFCGIIAAYYLFQLGNGQSDELTALVVLTAFGIVLAVSTIANLAAIERRRFNTGLYVLNFTIVIIMIIFLITEFQASSPDRMIWFGATAVLLVNSALLWRFRSPATLE